MADKDTIGSMTDEVPEEATVKTAKKSSILPIILKWVAIVLAVGIFVVAITLITVTIRDKKGKGYTDYPTSPEYRDTSEILTYYTNIDEVSTNLAGQPPATVQVKVNLGYSQNDKNTPGEIAARSVEIQDFLLFYFKGKTYDELVDNAETVKIEIRNLINDNILTKGKIKRVMIDKYNLLLQE